MAITLTESAASHVAAFLSKRGKGVGLRLGVRTSGCSGLAYKLEYADEVRPEDREFESHGVRVSSIRRAFRISRGWSSTSQRKD